MTSKSQIVSLAEAGVPHETIAARMGISASYVSQVLSENSIKTKVLEANLALLDERTQRDARYDAIEDELLTKLKEKLPSFYKPQDILRSLIAINKAERRGATSQQLAELSNTKESAVVALELPERIRTRIIKSHSREIVSVNGRALITKDSRVLMEEVTSETALAKLAAEDPFDVDLADNNNNDNNSNLEPHYEAVSHSSQNNFTSESLFTQDFSEHSSSAENAGN